jgi:hypothetical protein
MEDRSDLPEYVDAVTPRLKWYTFNTVTLLASGLMVYLASLIIEFEIAKLSKPDISFITTPTGWDLGLAGLTIGLGLVNIAVLVFVFLRHLWLRKWMIGTTLLGWMALALIALILGSRFMPVVFPTVGLPPI